ncbi:metal ABC transporter solute-binding protein, Zn/Mn family [Rhodoligotrophos defluvii]|uniref:metal ABC transporter solute-binding protein, Zn/Mn family n=1 Tax=Rhodoligotrophos defluvii TaxID=2561934 RepID=UPI0010CA1E08|nr:zinc ABC transporter substrate-binding protein [Rhodoligotrophos defluvii]
MGFSRARRSLLTGSMAALLLSAAAPAVLSDRAHAETGKPLQLVATTSMIADAVRQVGGSHVQVQALMGPGVDPHLYRQTSSDIAAMSRADAVFWHGLRLEAQLIGFLEQLGARRPVFALADALPEDQLIRDPAYPDQFDPHVWMDPNLWKGVVVAARDALTELRPEGKADFAANAERHLAEIDALDAYARNGLATVPQSSRVLVTAHDAFHYFGRAYGYEVLGIQGISTESEAGLKQIEHLVDVLVERKIGAIFVETSVSDRNVRALIEGAAAKGHAVTIGGTLFSDAMGKPGTYEGTYIGMIDHNVTTITRALGGDAPARGLNDKLAAL